MGIGARLDRASCNARLSLYKMSGTTVVSFSGDRTSAYMLRWTAAIATGLALFALYGAR
ncbi:hypothetical protein [Pseudomonas syringae]|uniref:hypothetical protein n=1 Tax=Pseudomonas syringae TaxID=317 RepID=UPI0006CB621B|nr:hypothetical protein [Pseudomonas syringae]ALE00126.1 hypothetical protein PSYRMG_04660 [Pseudomonas syringae UMAF0158]MCK9733906.1 hypothetical protein [Pseudomonas syringae pv. syringae]